MTVGFGAAGVATAALPTRSLLATGCPDPAGDVAVTPAVLVPRVTWWGELVDRAMGCPLVLVKSFVFALSTAVSIAALPAAAELEVASRHAGSACVVVTGFFPASGAARDKDGAARRGWRCPATALTAVERDAVEGAGDSSGASTAVPAASVGALLADVAVPLARFCWTSNSLRRRNSSTSIFFFTQNSVTYSGVIFSIFALPPRFGSISGSRNIFSRMILRASSEETDLFETAPLDALLGSRANGAVPAAGCPVVAFAGCAEGSGSGFPRSLLAPIVFPEPADAVRFGTEKMVSLDKSSRDPDPCGFGMVEAAGERVLEAAAVKAMGWVIDCLAEEAS